MGRKFTLWLADHGLTIHAFSGRYGLARQSMAGWLKHNVRIPADALATIARATGLPEAYWLDGTLPYPPPLDYMNSRERAAAVLTTLSAEDVAWLLEIAGDPRKLRQARALWTAAKGDGRG